MLLLGASQKYAASACYSRVPCPIEKRKKYLGSSIFFEFSDAHHQLKLHLCPTTKIVQQRDTRTKFTIFLQNKTNVSSRYFSIFFDPDKFDAQIQGFPD